MIAWISLLLLSARLWAASPPNDVQKQVALKQNKIINMEVKQEGLLKELIFINKKIKSQATKMGAVQKEIEILNAEIERQKESIKATSKELVESKKRLTTKIRAISKIKSGNPLQVALAHSSLMEIEKNLKMMGIVASYDVQFITDYYEKKIALGKELKNLDSRYKELKKKESHLAERKSALENESRARLVWLEEVKKTKLFTETEIQRIRKNKNNSFEDLGVFDVFSKDTILKNKGMLVAPIDGSLIIPYGVNAISDAVLVSNSGVFVATESNRAVKALFNAEVVFIGNLDGLGKVVILDHGDNYYSVYGNVNNVAVKSRQIVRTGQSIAQADYNPLFNSNGLYFEMRHYSQSLNPKDWIRSFHESN